MRNKQALDDILFLIEMIDDMGALDEAEALYGVRAEYDRDHGRDNMARENDEKMWRVQDIRERLHVIHEWVKRQEKFWAGGDE